MAPSDIKTCLQKSTIQPSNERRPVERDARCSVHRLDALYARATFEHTRHAIRPKGFAALNARRLCGIDAVQIAEHLCRLNALSAQSEEA